MVRTSEYFGYDMDDPVSRGDVREIDRHSVDRDRICQFEQEQSQC
jgi:hypothetical protein